MGYGSLEPEKRRKNMHGDGCKKITKIKRGVGYSTWHGQFQTTSFLL